VGWYKEYLKDLADIERAENEEKFFFVASAVSSFILSCAIYGVYEFWGNEYLYSIGCVLLSLLLIIPTFFLWAKFGGGLVAVIACLIVVSCDIGGLVISEQELDQKTSAPVEFKKPEPGYTSEQMPAKKLQPSYLDAIDRINNNVELGLTYYDIANKFHDNKMGLKGSPEQIEAGNQLMERVYDFLGSSAQNYAQTGKMYSVDSMETLIQNTTVVSDFRKKKAREELKAGVKKIKTCSNSAP